MPGSTPIGRGGNYSGILDLRYFQELLARIAALEAAVLRVGTAVYYKSTPAGESVVVNAPEAGTYLIVQQVTGFAGVNQGAYALFTKVDGVDLRTLNGNWQNVMFINTLNSHMRFSDLYALVKLTKGNHTFSYEKSAELLQDANDNVSGYILRVGT